MRGEGSGGCSWGSGNRIQADQIGKRCSCAATYINTIYKCRGKANKSNIEVS
jgi:hypothetical protein